MTRDNLTRDNLTRTLLAVAASRAPDLANGGAIAVCPISIAAEIGATLADTYTAASRLCFTTPAGACRVAFEADWVAPLARSSSTACIEEPDMTQTNTAAEAPPRTTVATPPPCSAQPLRRGPLRRAPSIGHTPS